MPTQSKSPVVCVKGPQRVKPYLEAASQTFVKGEPVYLDGSGNVAEFTAAIDTGGQRFIGFAAQDAHNDSVAGSHKVEVYVGQENVFEANINATGSDQVSALTQIGSGPLPLYRDTSLGIAMVDIANPGGPIDCARIVSINKGTIGDTNARVEFTLVDSALQVLGN